MQLDENTAFDELNVGDTVQVERVLTDQKLNAPSASAEGRQPERPNEDSRNWIPGEIWAGPMISGAVAAELPGSVIRRETLRFDYPAALGEAVTVRLTVKSKDSESRRVVLECQCSNRTGEVLVSGEIIVTKSADTAFSVDQSSQANFGSHGAQHTRLIAATETLDPILTAVVHPCDAASLQGALSAMAQGLIKPILVGPAARIKETARDAGADLNGVSIVDARHSHAAAEIAVKLAREGKAEALMKGALHTDEVMSAAVDAATGLRTERRMSHVFVMDVPSYPKPLLITDAAINIAPNLRTKADIAQNAIELAHALGVSEPKLAILAAVETVYPAMPSTVEAAALCKMADRGQISGGLLDGPLAFDNAISKEAAQTKGIVSEVAGEADILLAPDLEAGNMIAKQLIYLAGARSAGLVVGARVPIMLTSRADGIESRVASASLAQLLVRHRDKQLKA